jgi:hypothetical protein
MFFSVALNARNSIELVEKVSDDENSMLETLFNAHKNTLKNKVDYVDLVKICQNFELFNSRISHIDIKKISIKSKGVSDEPSLFGLNFEEFKQFMILLELHICTSPSLGKLHSLPY